MPQDAPLLRLAVVDDHALVRDGFAATVDHWPHGRVVLQAEHGLDYERQCAELGHIHIALVDLCMPVRDGVETLRWMARHQPRTKAMAITYDPHPPAVKRALQAGACAVLHKNIRRAELLRALDHVRLTGFHHNELVSRELRRSATAERDPPPAPHTLWARLTDREREFLLLYTRPDVPTLLHAAQRMGIGPGTAETYRKALVAKLGVHSKAELVRLVLTHGWG